MVLSAATGATASGVSGVRPDSRGASVVARAPGESHAYAHGHHTHHQTRPTSSRPDSRGHGIHRPETARPGSRSGAVGATGSTAPSGRAEREGTMSVSGRGGGDSASNTTASSGTGAGRGHTSASSAARAAAADRGATPSAGGVSDYSIGKVLGEGGFCEVRLGLHQRSRRKVAIKVIDKVRLSDLNDRKRVAREIKVLKKLHHVCIIRCFDVIDTPSKIYLVMEVATAGSLLDYVRQKKKLDEAEACKVLQQIVYGLIYCHAKGVVHRDVKLENLLLDAEKNIRIVDFGLSAITAPGKRLKVFCGSPSYAAPEIVARQPYDGPPVDVWSLGVVLFATVSGYLPFHAAGDRQALCRKIMKGHFTTPESLSGGLKDLLHRMLTVDPEQRITMKQILQHPWVTSNVRWVPPLANRYTIQTDVSGSPLAHPDILAKMEQLGHNSEDLLAALVRRDVNHVTATYFLLQDQWLERQGGDKSQAHAVALVRAASAQGRPGSATPSRAAGGTGGRGAPSIPSSDDIGEQGDTEKYPQREVRTAGQPHASGVGEAYYARRAGTTHASHRRPVAYA
jgi:5'-AMP-activated protein kinase, catalytic alpha subunit